MNRTYLQHFREKDSWTPCWYEFAINFLDQNLKSLFPDENLQGWTFDFKETKTESLIEINATLRILHYSDESDSNTLHTFKSFNGKCTCPLETSRQPTKRKTMEAEAKVVALKEFFKKQFGFNTNEYELIDVDEFHRPITIDLEMS